jgi:hypothetical protein
MQTWNRTYPHGETLAGFMVLHRPFASLRYALNLDISSLVRNLAGRLGGPGGWRDERVMGRLGREEELAEEEGASLRSCRAVSQWRRAIHQEKCIPHKRR